MYRKPLYAALLLTCAIPTFASAVPIVWINEFHYDNAAGDTGEFIEVAGLAGTDLTGYSILLYNGSNGALYDTIALSGVLSDAAGGFGALSFVSPGLQNGAPDGIALVSSSGVEQFLSYEGSFGAVGGAADGTASTDVGVSENGSQSGTSLGLIGVGSSYSDFTWALILDDSPGLVNAGQTFRERSAHGVPDAASTAALLVATMLGIVGLSRRRYPRITIV